MDIRDPIEFERRVTNAGVFMTGVVLHNMQALHSAFLGMLNDYGVDPGGPAIADGHLEEVAKAAETARTLLADSTKALEASIANEMSLSLKVQELEQALAVEKDTGFAMSAEMESLRMALSASEARVKALVEAPEALALPPENPAPAPEAPGPSIPPSETPPPSPESAAGTPV